VDPVAGIDHHQTFVLDVVGLDRTLLQVARACAVVNLGHSQKIELDMRALPGPCKDPPTSVDLMLTFDTSTTMAIVDPDGAHLDGLFDTLLDPMQIIANSTFGLVTFGQGSAQEIIPQTSDLDLIRGGVMSLKSLDQGDPLLYDGVQKGAALLRSRAVCGRRPLLLIVSSDSDRGSSAVIEDAQVGIYGAQGDTSDDIYTFGLGLSDNAYSDLNDIVPIGGGVVTHVGTGDQIHAAYVMILVQLRMLLTPS
jgi:hypothetical protein